MTIGHSARHPSFLAGALVVILALITEIFVWQIDTSLEAAAEARLLEQASDARALLEAEVSEGIYITIGLESFIRSREGRLPVDDLDRWLATLFENTKHLRNIGLAPGNNIEAVFPISGNEGVLGLDYRELDNQWPAIANMMQTGDSSLVGPINLVQGGVGLIYRRPVFIDEQYWGLISTVMVLDSILSVLNQSTQESPSYYRLRTIEADGYSTIAGDLAPVSNRVSKSLVLDLPGNLSWELTLSEPKALWPLWGTRLVLWGFGLLLIMYGWQWRRARELQLRTNREKIDFIHTVSHELRTPLTSITGALALLEREPTSSSTSERLITLANRNAKRLERLVSEVLDIARLDASRMSFSPETLNVFSLLEQAVENNGSQGNALGVALRLHRKTTGDQLYVKADEQRLLQILDNLISNAIKFSNPGQEVELSVALRQGRITVTVQDHGIGIPDHFQARLFERFARADHSDKRRNQSGTGLGLSIARELARQMGGDIRFQSTEGKGSQFMLDLPSIPHTQT